MVFTRPTRCSNGGCLVVTFEDGRVLLRDSKDPDSPAVRYSLPEWAAVLADTGPGVPFPVARTLYGGGYAWVGPNETLTGLVTLEFDGDEMDTFVKAARAGEYVPAAS